VPVTGDAAVVEAEFGDSAEMIIAAMERGGRGRGTTTDSIAVHTREPMEESTCPQPVAPP
jgi:adenosylcobinamide amidohydrolase